MEVSHLTLIFLRILVRANISRVFPLHFSWTIFPFFVNGLLSYFANVFECLLFIFELHDCNIFKSCLYLMDAVNLHVNGSKVVC